MDSRLSRRKSSVVANIIIPEALIRASRGSGTGIAHDVPAHEEQGAHHEKRASQQDRPGSTAHSRLSSTARSCRLGSTAPVPRESTNRSGSAGITELKPANLQLSPGGRRQSTSALGQLATAQEKPNPKRPDLFHHLSGYSIGTPSPGASTPAPGEEEQDRFAAEPDPHAPRAVAFADEPETPPHRGHHDLEQKQGHVGIVEHTIPHLVHQRPSVALAHPHRIGSKSTLQSIAASIVQPFDPHRRGSRRPSRRFSRLRKNSIYDVYEKAKKKGVEIKRARWAQLLFEYAFYVVLLAVVYFILVGRPVWGGAVWWLWIAVKTKFSVMAGFVIVLGFAVIYAFAPLFILFEKDPPPVAASTAPSTAPSTSPSTASHTSVSGSETDNPVRGTKPDLDTALLIPCYKSAAIIGATLEAALKVFPASHIFVVANGNSPTPLDDTEAVCMSHGVNHIWSPIGSKIVAQFVGCYAAKAFRNVLLIDDDCLIPPNFPIVGDRLVGKVKCIGYMIKSVGPNRSVGNWCQQAQDMEYKISGLQRAFAGKCGSATFPHGAISLWDREFLVKVFHDHPGFSISEDWFFGHSCRRLGGRTKMCSAVFVETETPPAIFFSSSGSSRGGFGEMTVFKQRFTRWNFFFVTGLWYNCHYILCSWKLGWWEIGAKLAVLQEVYETALYLFTPFILPMSVAVNPAFWGYVLVGTMGLYFLNVAIFNEIHLRLKKERVSWPVLIFYYTFYKVVFTFVNVVSCYWSIYKYARYFAQRHPKVVEDEKVVEVVLCMEEEAMDVSVDKPDCVPAHGGMSGRRFTVTTVPQKTEV